MKGNLRPREDAMLTATSILESLPAKKFPSYRSLLSEVAIYWQSHAARLPSEFGPRDLVVRAVSMRLIRRAGDGTVEIVIAHGRAAGKASKRK